jgi:propanol-preferring alcohol dehydrogenase
MKAFELRQHGPVKQSHASLECIEKAIPEPEEDQFLVRVTACGVCRTELDEIEGRLELSLPIVPGHQIVGYIQEAGAKTSRFKLGERVGISWINSACGMCFLCRKGQENLCRSFLATGRDVDGGYAEYVVVSENFCFAIPENFSDVEAAPLLCAGSVGYRSLLLTGLENGRNVGLTGFGASGHLVLKLIQHLYPASRIFVFARSQHQRRFALELGACWAGDIMERSPETLHAIIDTTPAWQPVISSLENLEAGGRLVINAIRKEDRDKKKLLQLCYEKHFWQEKELKSVANVTRRDVVDFLHIAEKMAIKPEVEIYPFVEANRALCDLKAGAVRGAKVLSFV